MIPFTLGWLIGLWLAQQWPHEVYWVALAAIASILVTWRLSAIRNWQLMSVGVLAGVLWLQAWMFMHPPVLTDWLHKPVVAQVKIEGLSAVREHPHVRLQVRARVERVRHVQSEQWHPADWPVRLRVYGEDARRFVLKPGERWQMLLRLTPVHGWVNEAGFDYERWAWSQGLQALARVVDAQQAVRLGQAFSLQQLRAVFDQRIAAVWRDSPHAGFYDALSYGERARITPEQWALLRGTGTSHLMAISGLHMGMVAALGYGLFFWLWRWLPFLWQRMARPHFAVVGMLLIATLYLLLSGAAIPAQRAWLMVVLVGVLLWRRRFWHPWGLLALVALLITLWHPPSVLSAGFWLSFSAVAIIFALLTHAPLSSPTHRLLSVQVALLIGLAPLTLALFQQSAGLAGWVNLLLVPLLPFMLIWLALLSLVALIQPEWAHWLVVQTDWVWSGMVQLLQWAVEHAPMVTVSVPFWLALLWTLAFVFWLAQPRRWQSFALASSVLLMGLLWHERPAAGSAHIRVLDVGQGQAVVVETSSHVLVYDAGPRWGRLDAGETVLAVLRHRGWHQVDRLIVSHSDWDHAGGAETLRRGMPVREVIAGQPERLAGSRSCEDGETWQWDGVNFALFRWPNARSDNDASCVLWVGVGRTGALMTGDLTRPGERWLLGRMGDAYLVEWMLAGHHGSRTSNDETLLDRLGVQQVAISAGYHNRFSLPAAEVRARWQKRDIKTHCTGCEGALIYALDKHDVRLIGQGRAQSPTIYRHACIQK